MASLPPFPEPTVGQTAERPAAERLSDAQVARVLETVNRGEIQQGELATAKAESVEVRSYAERMVDEHQKALDRTVQVAADQGVEPAPSDLDEELSAKGESTIAELRQKSGESFDREYLRTQIEAHRKVLGLIDDVLLPSTRDPALRATIEAVRPVVSSHLAHAESLQAGD